MMRRRTWVFSSNWGIWMTFCLAGCDLVQPAPERPGSAIRWADGDSGEIDGRRFRLADVNAPETGPVGAEHGAQCEGERQLGVQAKSFMQEQTRTGTLAYRELEEDRYGRMVIELIVEGADLIRLGLDSGYLQSWPHFNGRALSSKPDWC